MKLTIGIAVFAALFAAGCKSPEYVRDTDRPDIDEAAMSTRLDRKDLDRLYQENVRLLVDSKIAREWDRIAAAGDPAVVAIFPIRNETSEHVSEALDALLSKFETDLVNQSSAEVVSYESQPDLIAEIKTQQADGYDPVRLAKYGVQLGAQYFVTGKVHSVTEKVDDERRVQYFMFLQVIDVSTGAIKFQNESKVTKGLLRD
jgi:PBP1b-binding outer membrane lipoprotein LpoB